MIGKSQFDVCGAKITTARGTSGARPTRRQPAAKSSARARNLTSTDR
jgi:hypothetical protein